MRSFDEIFAISAARKGGAAALESQLAAPLPAKKLAEIPDDRWLSTLSRCVFQAGFNWKVVAAKWPGFEEAFHGFDPGRVAMMEPDAFDALLSDSRVVRNGTKLQSVIDNAAFILDLRQQGGAGTVLGGWPASDFVGLLDRLKRDGSRLGGSTAMFAMRFMGRDAFVLSPDVQARLRAEGVFDGAAGSKKSMRAIQEAFNVWMDQSGRSLTEISRVLAMSL